MTASSGLILVTGASGFLGREIVGQLLRSQFEVRALARRSIDGVDTIQGDIRDREVCGRAVAGVRTVIHAAGMAHVFGEASEAREEFLSVNEEGTRILCEEAVDSGVAHFVLVSSVSVYGVSGRTEDQPCEPEGPYAVSKLRSEEAAIEATTGTRTALTILRMATIYGRGDRGNVARLGEAIRRGRFLWISNGRNRKSLIHRTDAARACVEIATGVQGTGQVFNVSAPHLQMREIVDTIATVLERRPPRVSLPILSGLVRFASAVEAFRGRPRRMIRAAEKFISDDAYPADKISEWCGFRCRTSLIDGLKEQFLPQRNED